MSTSHLRNKVTKVKKKVKPSSYDWLNRQLNDPYVIKAKYEGYRSRAAYKLIEINEKFNILNKNSTVLDLGAAPGGWSQVASRIIGDGGKEVVAIDLLPIEYIPGVIDAQMDFYDPKNHELIRQMLKDGFADVVLSDMAPNTTGHHKTDHLRIIDLCERSFYFAITLLRPGGHFVAKILCGGAENELLKDMKKNFEEVRHFKPKSSRSDSREMYVVAKKFRG